MHKYIFFTALFILFVTDPAVAQESRNGPWYITKQKDVINDSNSSLMVNYQSSNDKLTLGLLCRDGALRVAVVHKYFGGRDDNIHLTYRFDSGSFVGPHNWTLAETKKVSFMPLRQVNGFVAAARTATTLHIRAVDLLDGETLTASLSMRGFSGALSLLNNCR
jgi:hypothetical protein